MRTFRTLRTFSPPFEFSESLSCARGKERSQRSPRSQARRIKMAASVPNLKWVRHGLPCTYWEFRRSTFLTFATHDTSGGMRAEVASPGRDGRDWYERVCGDPAARATEKPYEPRTEPGANRGRSTRRGSSRIRDAIRRGRGLVRDAMKLRCSWPHLPPCSGCAPRRARWPG